MTKRASISKAKRIRIFDAEKGVCHLCQQPIKLGEKWDVEHPKGLWAGGSDDERDLRPAHADCHKPKTAAESGQRAKADRQRAKHIGAKPMPKMKIANRGFDSPVPKREPKTRLPPRRLFERAT